MPNRTGTVVSLSVGIVSIIVFIYCSSYYVSQNDPTRIAISTYSLVMCLHLLVPVIVGVSSAVIASRSLHRAISLTLMCVWLFLAITSLLASVTYVRALIDFDIPSDSGVVVHKPVVDHEGMTRVAVALVRPFGRAFVAGLMLMSLIAGVVLPGAVAQARARWREVTAALCGWAALLSFGYLAWFLMFRVSWNYYGGIHAFCVMAMCLLALPLFIASFDSLLMQINVSVAPFVAWTAISVAAVALLVVTVTDLARARVFLRDTGPIELHGLCASMANRPLFGTVCVMIVLAVAFFIARGAVRGADENELEESIR